jgi:hypothetical protein
MIPVRARVDNDARLGPPRRILMVTPTKFSLSIRVHSCQFAVPVWCQFAVPVWCPFAVQEKARRD